MLDIRFTAIDAMLLFAVLVCVVVGVLLWRTRQVGAPEVHAKPVDWISADDLLDLYGGGASVEVGSLVVLADWLRDCGAESGDAGVKARLRQLILDFMHRVDHVDDLDEAWVLARRLEIAHCGVWYVAVLSPGEGGQGQCGGLSGMQLLSLLALISPRPGIKGDVLTLTMGKRPGYRCAIPMTRFETEGFDEVDWGVQQFALMRGCLTDFAEALIKPCRSGFEGWRVDDYHAVCLAARWAYRGRWRFLTHPQLEQVSVDRVQVECRNAWLPAAVAMIESAPFEVRVNLVSWVLDAAGAAGVDGREYLGAALGRVVSGRVKVVDARAVDLGARGVVEPTMAPARVRSVGCVAMPTPVELERRRQDLLAQVPWAAAAINIVFGELGGRSSAGAPIVGLAPLLIVGPKGCGKSHFAKLLGHALDLPLMICSPRYSVASELDAALAQRGVGNAMVLVDDLDVLCEQAQEMRSSHDLLAAVNGLMDAAGGGQLAGRSVGGVPRGSASYGELIWVATASDRDLIRSDVRVGFRVLRMGELKPQHYELVARRRLVELAKSWRVDVTSLPAYEDLDLDLGRVTGARSVCQVVDRAVERLALAMPIAKVRASDLVQKVRQGAVRNQDKGNDQ